MTRRSIGTLCETSLMMLIVAMLAGIVLVLPFVQNAREQMRRAKCQNNLRQISISPPPGSSAYAIMQSITPAGTE